MIPPSVYAFYFGWFTKPVAFSGMYFTWFFNPHVGYLEDKDDSYYNGCQRFNNTFIFFALIALYAVFSVLYAIKNYKYSKLLSKRSGKSQKMIFIQVLAMSAVNAAASGIYLYEQFAEIGKFVIVLGQFAWISAHGLPAVIYLFMNKTLRRDVQEMLSNPWGRSNTVTNNSSVRGKSTVMLV
ncbi:Protein SRT-41 [Aphelenchoides avenae]|nr:Protein SRT-41 [Aphelenchus avenae]